MKIFFPFLMKNLFYILKDVLTCVVNRHVSMYGFDASAL